MIDEKWFTLVELLVVILLIFLITMVTAKVNFSRITETESSDRMVSKVSSIIKTERSNSALWRWFSDPAAPTKIINYDYSQIHISTWSIVVNYYKSNPFLLLWTWAVLKDPFFSNSSWMYKIKDLQAITPAWTVYSWSTIDIVFDNITSKSSVIWTWKTMAWTDVTFTDWIVFKASIWYKSKFNELLFDWRTWMIQVR